MKNIYIISFVIFCFLTGCNKYKPVISFTDEHKRLIGEWKLNEITSSGTGVNGQSSSGSTKAFYQPTILKLDINQTASLDGYMITKDLDSVMNQSISGIWILDGKKFTLKWDGDNVYNPEIQEYEIKYLTKKELQISFHRVNYGGGISGLVSDFTTVYKFKK